MSHYTAQQQRNIDTVNNLFEADASYDRISIFVRDAVWWNGLPHVANNGATEHKGIDAIIRLMSGSGDPSNLKNGIDAYDLTTNRFEDVLVLADGDFVVRQHTQKSKTHSGRDYCNVYCFVVKFNDEGKIIYLTEHWNTWHAHRFLLDNFHLEPAHPNG
ncbi:MAG: hypothetical protein R3E64_03450 [Halioglobus sp.]